MYIYIIYIYTYLLKMNTDESEIKQHMYLLSLYQVKFV